MKRILALVLSLLLVLSLAPMTLAEEQECPYFGEDCPSAGMSDVAMDAWFHEAVDDALASGRMNGIGGNKFDPAGKMTRAMYATVLYRMLTNVAPDEGSGFTDVAEDTWYSDAVAFVEDEGLMNGVGGGKFAPEGTLTREQMITINYRLCIWRGAYLGESTGDLSAFKDADLVSEWAKEAMIWMVANGAIQGDGQGYLNPKANACRAEAACSIIQIEMNEDIVYADVVVGNEQELKDAIAEGGQILIEKEIALSGSEVIQITADTTLILRADLDFSAHTSRPFAVDEGVSFGIIGGDYTVKTGKYGLINIPNGDEVYIYLEGGNYEGKTDNGSFIKPRGTGKTHIDMFYVNVTDESENGGWLVDGSAHSGELHVSIEEGVQSAYNGISSAERIDINCAEMTFVHTGIHACKTAEVNNATITVLNGGTEAEKHAAPSAAIIAYSNGYIEVLNSTLDCAADALAVYTSGGTIEAKAVTIKNGTVSEYHPRDHYPDAEFLITVDGEVPKNLRFPNCEGKDPCADCFVFVETEDELRAALAEGGKIVVTEDIAMDADSTVTIPSGKKVDLYLNNYTLAGESSAAGNKNREMFLVKGTMNVYNGSISIEHTGTDMGWNAMTTVFDVTAGGVLNVKNATIENLGGSAMNFAVHLNNWGEVTLNAENSVFDATYCAVRVFNSGFDKNNVSFENCVLHGNSMAFWVHNYIGDLDSSQHSDEAINARLNFDLFNGTNEISGGTAENPKNNPVRFGFGDAIFFDGEGNQL